jgi:outer membrane protein OmpA-like peptidoglycan-associated protein
MANLKRSQAEDSHWIGYTDIFASSLLILILVTVVSAINNANNQKPPLITLTETQSFRFDTGSHRLSDNFKFELKRKLDKITEDIVKYNIDTIEVIGHTDGQPSPGGSNLDFELIRNNDTIASFNSTNFQAGSNMDLGLLRALAVASFLKNQLSNRSVDVPYITTYSAGSLIDIEGRFNPATNLSDSKRRRIEIRFTRSQS